MDCALWQSLQCWSCVSVFGTQSIWRISQDQLENHSEPPGSLKQEHASWAENYTPFLKSLGVPLRSGKKNPSGHVTRDVCDKLWYLYPPRHKSRQTYNNPLLNGSSWYRLWQEWNHRACARDHREWASIHTSGAPSICPSLVPVQTEVESVQ